MANSLLMENLQLIMSSNALFAKFKKKADIFMSLCSTLNMRTTANAMLISLGGISYKLKTFESLLGTKLFIRKGRNGLVLTDEGKQLRDFLKTNVFNKEKNVSTETCNNNSNIVNISAHPLASSVYVIPAIKKNADKNVRNVINLSISTRDDAFNDLLSHKTDILIYPLEWDYIARYIQDDICFTKIKPYNLVLYMNKENYFSDKKLCELSWSDASKMNIVPRNEKVQFLTANSFFKNKENNEEGKITTTCADMSAMYKGLIENVWTMASGNEFSKIFDCSSLISKEIYSSQNELGIVANWFICTRKNENSNGEEKCITNIVQQIAKEMSSNTGNQSNAA